MKKAILITYKSLQNTTFKEIVEKDIPNSEWFPSKFYFEKDNVYKADVNNAYEAFESGELTADDFDIIISTCFAEIVNAKDENYNLDMILDQAEVVEKEWLDDEDNESIREYAEMGFETWEDIVTFELSEALGFVSFAEIE